MNNQELFNTLISAYNVIFLVDLKNNNVTCTHCVDTSPIGDLAYVDMKVDQAIKFWVNHSIVPEDRAQMEDYFKRAATKGYVKSLKRPLQAEFTIKVNHNNNYYNYIVVTIAMDDDQELVCLRDITKLKYNRSLVEENQRFRILRDHYETILKKQADGIASIKIDDDKVYLLSGATVYPIFKQYYNIDFKMDKGGIPMSVFLEQVNLTKQDLAKAMVEDKILKLKLENSEYNVEFKKDDPHNPNIYDLYFYKNSLPSNKKIFIRTFGYFDIFVNGNAISFSNSKEKELLALLVDRHGGVVTLQDGLTCLFDGKNDEKTKAKYRKIAMYLNRTLQKYGLSDLIINNHGSRSLNTSMVECDYYELLNGNPKYKEAFMDSYLTSYPWAQETLESLLVLTSE